MWVGSEKVKISIQQNVTHAKLISLWLVRVRAKSHMNSATHKSNTPPASDSNQTTVRPQPVAVVEICSKFILDEVMDKKAKRAVDLVKLDVTDKNLQKRDMEFGYRLKHEIKLVKPEVTDMQIKEFERNAVKFLATMCHHMLQNSPLKIPFVRWCRCFNPLYISDNPDACRKLLDSLLENWWCRSALLLTLQMMQRKSIKIS